ncbi:NAD(P)H-dependent oxidoreductase subunit E [Mycoplasmatota bacterium]|nr:NAD(P)H-dependent oxidoreductase subunit E [Mycoplasmatota bacterium]
MKNKFLPEQLAEFEKSIAENAKDQAGLLKSIHLAQKVFGGVPVEIQRVIGKHHDASISKISGIVTFYDYFTSDIQGKNIIEVCVGTTCYVQEANDILKKVCEITKCEPNSTSRNKEFSVVIGRCLGKCELAPNVIINHKTHNKVTIDKVTELLKGI